MKHYVRIISYQSLIFLIILLFLAFLIYNLDEIDIDYNMPENELLIKAMSDKYNTWKQERITSNHGKLWKN